MAMVAQNVNVPNNTELCTPSGQNGKFSVMCSLPQLEKLAERKWGRGSVKDRGGRNVGTNHIY